MKHSISKFLSQPYPFYYEGKSLRVIMLLFLLMTFFFNYAFEPFNVVHSEHKMDFFWISVIHSLTPVIVLFALALAASALNLEPGWNIKKEAAFIFLFFLFVGIIQFLIRDLIYNNADNWSWRYLIEEVRNTFLVGSLFVIILLPWNFNRLNVKNIRTADALNRIISENPGIAKKTPDHSGSVQVDHLELNPDQLMFVKSEGNYLEVYLHGKKPNKVLIRFTLKDLETLLDAYPNMIKTHRSYLVNSKYIERIKGNAQGYQLHFSDYVVPVSRNMITNFNQRVKIAQETMSVITKACLPSQN